MDSAAKSGTLNNRRARIRARAAAGGRTIRHESEIPDEQAVTADVVSTARGLDDGGGAGDEGGEVVGALEPNSIDNEEHDVVEDSLRNTVPSESVASENPSVSMMSTSD